MSQVQRRVPLWVQNWVPVCVNFVLATTLRPEAGLHLATVGVVPLCGGPSSFKMKCFVAMPVCLTQTDWKAAFCTTSGMATAIKSRSGRRRRFRTKLKGRVHFPGVWKESIISSIARCMGLTVDLSKSALMFFVVNGKP